MQNKINLKKKNIDLNETVKNAAGDIIHEYEGKGVKLEIKVQTEPVFLDADPLRIAQTVENILSNALKFTQENGTVRLTLKKEKNYAVINIKDSSIGISRKFCRIYLHLSHRLTIHWTEATAGLDWGFPLSKVL